MPHAKREPLDGVDALLARDDRKFEVGESFAYRLRDAFAYPVELRIRGTVREGSHQVRLGLDGDAGEEQKNGDPSHQ